MWKFPLLVPVVLSCLVGSAMATEGLGQIGAAERTITATFSSSLPNVKIIELRLTETYSPESDSPPVWSGKGDDGECAFPRFDGARDRLCSKFLLVDADNGQALGTAQFVTDLSELKHYCFELPGFRSIKGLSCPVVFDELDELGVTSVTTNVNINEVVYWDGRESALTWPVDGEEIPINTAYLAKFDKHIKTLTAEGVSVVVVLNNPIPKERDPSDPFIHPNTDPEGTPFGLGAFNVATERGIRYYRAAMEVLVDRYSRPGGEHGWISGYIVGNELTSHSQWYNIGDMTIEPFVEQYGAALHIADLAVRQTNPSARIYISLDHFWGKAGFGPTKGFGGKEFLERLAAWSREHGNFPWHVAFHPYPEDLFNPRFWEDKLAFVSFNTPVITFKNIEVLTAFLRKEAMLYEGEPRRVIFSEQGFHADPSEEGELLQAAAYAAAFYRVSKTPGVDAFMLHRHVSHPGEGGLRLGLRDFDVKTKLPIYEVFRLAGTDQWEEAFEFAKPIIGIKKWSELDPVTDIPERVDIGKEFGMKEPNVVASLWELSETAELQKSWEFKPILFEEGEDARLSIRHHPQDDGVGTATYHIALPSLAEGHRALFRFATGFSADTVDGVTFAVQVNGEELWSAHQDTLQAIEHEIDLSPFAGEDIALTLCVNAGETSDYDWSNWISPRVVIDEEGQREMDLMTGIIEGKNVVFIAAHPDDEIYAGSLLAFAADHAASAVLCATGGESGGNFLPEPQPITLREVRTRELAKAASILGASSEVFDCVNGTSKAHPEGLAVLESGEEAVARWMASGEGSHTPEEIVVRWQKECPEFPRLLRKRIKSMSPCIVITFEREHGITGHNEHRALALLVRDLFQKEHKTFEKADASLYQVIHPGGEIPSDLKVTSDQLNALGGRDYVQAAMDAFSQYESQFGPIDTPGNLQVMKDFRHYAETIRLRPIDISGE